MTDTNSSNNSLTFDVEAAPEFSFLTVNLPAGRTVKVEASAMAAMDTNISMKTKMKGGFKRFFAGESLFINEFTAQGGAGKLSIAPYCAGSIQHVSLNNQTIYLQSSAYLASSPEISVDVKWQGMKKGFFSGESFFLVKCSGTGDLWFNTFGAMLRIDEIDPNFVVDSGHIVAFTEGVNYNIEKFGGYKSLFLSGEGFVCRFNGQGTVWIQSRKPTSFLGWLNHYRPVGKN